MTFNIIAMICVAGISPIDCGPEPGFSRDVAKSAPFRNLARGESSKSCASEMADGIPPDSSALLTAMTRPAVVVQQDAQTTNQSKLLLN
jgi:hypothetical protein